MFKTPEDKKIFDRLPLSDDAKAKFIELMMEETGNILRVVEPATATPPPVKSVVTEV